MELVQPSEEYKASFIDAVGEFRAESQSNPSTESFRRLSLEKLENDFRSYVDEQIGFAAGQNLPPGYVPSSSFWLVDEGAYIGTVNIRHRMTEHLMAVGGHIGYAIRASMRGKGYGNKILELAIPEAKKLGIDRVLVTCDVTNLASRKIIEKNRGILENQVRNPETGIDKLRFWISV